MVARPVESTVIPRLITEKRLKTLPANMLVNKRLLKNGVLDFLKGLATCGSLPKGVIGFTEDWKPMVKGDALFDLKATHGLPLDFALDRIINEEGMAIDWVSFIEAAHKNGWWDFQIYEVVCHAMEDAMLPKSTISAIRYRMQRYVVEFPHPGMRHNV